MMRVRPIFGKLLNYSGESPGPATGITYTVQCQYSDLEAPFIVNGVRPSGFRWPTPMWTDAAATVLNVDTAMPFNAVGLEVGDEGASFTFWFFAECPYIRPCDGFAARSNGGTIVKDPITGKLVVIPPPDGPVTGTVTISGLNSLPVPGGES